jgi:spermidine synthase
MKSLATLLLAAALPCVLVAPLAAAEPVAPPADVEAAAPRPNVVFDQPSAFGRVIVVDQGRQRLLRFDDVNGVDQSAMSLDDPASVPMEYVRYAGMGLLFVPRLESMLMIGLGGGSFSGLIHRALPAARIDVVEINPVVVEAAKRFFGVVEDERYRVHLADGAAFVQDAGASYDLIFADGGDGDGIPEHLTTDRYFSALRERLTPAGVLVVNLGLDDSRNEIIARRIKAAFSGGVSVCVRTPVDANYLVFATMNAMAPDASALRARAAALDGWHLLPYPLSPLAARLGRCTSSSSP